MSNDLHTIKVPPEGPRTAKIMIVGEGPGRQEVAQGRPFIGPAGKELDRFLASAGLDRSDIFITNVTKVLPDPRIPKDDFFFAKTYKGKKILTRQPSYAYMEGIIELVSEIKEVNPNVIVPLGNYALWALTQHMGIGNYRGSILESTLIKGKKIIPTYHPAWYLYEAHKPNLRLLGNWDFARVAEQAHFPEIRRKRRSFIVDPTPEQILAAMERYTDPSLDHLTSDTEWYSPNELAYIAFSDNDEEAICITPDSMLAYRAIKAICESNVPKVWQNAMFDAVALWRRGIRVNNVAHDTMVAFHNCWGIILEKKSLGMIASVLTEEPYYKDDLEFVGKDDRGKIYCCTDTVVTDEAWTKMEREEFPLTGTRRGYEVSMTVMNTFIRAAQIGLRVDMPKLQALRKKYLNEATELEDGLGNKLGRPLPPRFCRSWQQVQKVVYDELGVGKRFTERSTKQEVLMDICATYDAEGSNAEIVSILKDIIRVRQNRNLCSRYITEAIVDPTDGRTRSFWNLAGTKNGRLSSTIPWWAGVAVQTLPGEAREFIIPDPGHCFVGWDLEQAEARIVAVKSNDFALLDAMSEGKDIHCMLGAVLFNTTYEDLMEEVARVGKDDCYRRALSKVTRHASNYYQTWSGLKVRVNREYIDTNLGIDAGMAKMLSSGFLKACPGLEPWWAVVLAQMNNEGYLENCFGRRRNFHGHTRYGEHEHRDGIAFEPQSTIADLTTLSIAEVDKMKYILPLAHMHDGGLLQVPEAMKDDAILDVQRCMTRELIVDGKPLVVPVELKAGYDWRNLKKVKL